MKDYKFLATDWSLCNRPRKQWVLGGTCLHCGLMAAHGKCLAPGERSNAICPPIKKYIKDLIKIKREAQG